MTRDRASKLASTIRQFWADRGYTVRAEVVREPWVKDVNSVGYTVRTNLKNGLPLDYKGEVIKP